MEQTLEASWSVANGQQESPQRDRPPGRDGSQRRDSGLEDSIRLYLQEIGRIPLLRAEEEIELARRIADLLDLETIRQDLVQQDARWQDPSEVPESIWAAAVKMEISEFRHRLRRGRQAKEKMVAANLRLVVSIAKHYLNRGVSFQDLIQEGSLGLIRAAEKFDSQKGFKFSTYATWWIRQAINRAIASQARTIRLPVHLYESLSKLKKLAKILSQELGRKPTEEELANHLEITVEKLRQILEAAQLPISLEMQVGSEDSELGEFIESDLETPDQLLEKEMQKESLLQILDTLSPREADVIRYRYGLVDGSPRTLKQIGEILCLSRERIRQIESKAMRKLRQPHRKNSLKVTVL
ncbi:MAG: RNA polymerase sigma factor, RpoD/SigA family [Synechococcaceae cyanobacterium SM2_3_1]|nr:RNA polymerase sigma factor, RpoD/SigA family [Synechococcaceae cyanobacterium SM2_3_1]